MADPIVPATPEQALAFLGLPAAEAPAAPLPLAAQVAAYRASKGLDSPGFVAELPTSNPATASATPVVIGDPVRGAPVGTIPGASMDMAQRYADFSAKKKLLDAQAGVPSAGTPKPAASEPKGRLLSPEAFDIPAPAPAAPAAPVVGAGTVLKLPSAGGGGGQELKEYKAGEKQIQQGLAEQAEAGRQQAVAEAGYRDELAKQDAAAIARQQAQRDYVAQSGKEIQAKYTALWADMSQPSGQVDPNRWWNSRSTGQKLAAFASAFATGFAGRPDVVQGFIDEDIAAQKDALDRTERGKATAFDAYGKVVDRVRQATSDTVQQENLLAALQAQYQEHLFQAQSARLKPGQQKAELDMAAGQQRQKYAEAVQQIRIRDEQQAAARYDHAFNQQLALQKLQEKTGVQAAELGQPVDPSLLSDAQGKRAVAVAPGKVVLALNEEYAKKLTEGIQSAHELLNVLDTALALRREYGSETLPTGAKVRMETVGKALIGALNKREKFGALDKGSQGLLEEMAGGKLTSFGQVEPALEQIRELLTTDMRADFVTYTGREKPGTGDAAVK